MKPLTQDALLRRRCQCILDAHRRRARAEGKTLDYDLNHLMLVASLSKTCHYCGLPLSLAFSFDHQTPIARGGKHCAGNLALCCQRCNCLKGALTGAEYLRLRELLAALHPAASEDIARRLLAGSSVYASHRGRKGR